MRTMRHLFTKLALLAMLLHVTAGAIPIMVEMNGGQALQICGSWGVQDITVDENGREIPAAPKASTCPFCAATAQTATPPASISQDVLPLPTSGSNYANLDTEWETFLPLHLYEGSPLLTRAPPIYS